MNTPDLSNIIIETPRLLLVPVDSKYADDILRESTPELRKYMRRKAPKDISETLAFVERAQEQRKTGEALRLTILDKTTSEFIGGTDIVQLNSRTPRLGAWIKQTAQGNKYGLETIKSLADWASHNVDYDYFILRIDKRNVPSIKIAETLGAVIDKEYLTTTEDGRTLTMVDYRLNR